MAEFDNGITSNAEEIVNEPTYVTNTGAQTLKLDKSMQPSDNACLKSQTIMTADEIDI